MSLPDWIRILAEIDRIIEASTQPFDANTIGNVRDLMGPLPGRYPTPYESPHFQTAPKVSANIGASANIPAKRSTSDSKRMSGMVGAKS